MSKQNAVLLIAVGVATVVALQWWKSQAKDAAASSASGTTATGKGGLTTTPIQTSAAAITAGLSTVTSYAANALSKIIALSAPVFDSVGDRMQRGGSEVVADAAYNATLRPDYVPTITAVDNVVYLNK